jgi:hypothetical protein
MLKTDFSPAYIVSGMRTKAQVWEHLLWTTGGALNLSKCFYYVVAWDFHKNGTTILLNPAAMSNTEISLTNGNGNETTPHPILQQDTYEEHRRLGVWPFPSGCNSRATNAEKRATKLLKAFVIATWARMKPSWATDIYISQALALLLFVGPSTSTN